MKKQKDNLKSIINYIMLYAIILIIVIEILK